MTTAKLRSALGIFAHNEAENLPPMLDSLRAQDIFSDPLQTGTIHILENGSTDNTAEIARNYIAAHPIPGWDFRAESLPVGGKARTWNTFVHELSDPAADAFVFLDGDIRLLSPDLLTATAAILAENTRIEIVSDSPVKHLAARANPSARDRLSLTSSRLAATGNAKLCGQFWAGRTPSIRRIHIPNGMLVEDGFLKAILLTDHFRQPEDLSKIVQIPHRHEFEAETRLPSIIKHERRILLGTLVNQAIFEHMIALRQSGDEPAAWLENQNARDPDWLAEFSRRKLRETPFHRQAREFILRPWTQWRQTRSPKLLPAALARLTLNTLVALSARRALHRNELHW